jgi:hypothetical protein
MSENGLSFQERWDLAVMEAQFPLGGKAPLMLPPALYEIAKDDPRFARIWMAPVPMLPEG